MSESDDTPDHDAGFAGAVVDTNVLVYATVDSAPKHEEARRWMAHLQREGTQLLATAQIYREYLVVLTRGEVFEQEFTPAEALDALSAVRRSLEPLVQTSETTETLLSLVKRYEVKGKQVHDANIVAVMRSHDVEAIATYNRGDFDRFEEITTLAPIEDG